MVLAIQDTTDLDYLLPVIEQGSVLGQCTIELERNPERPARTATLTVRGMQVTIESFSL